MKKTLILFILCLITLGLSSCSNSIDNQLFGFYDGMSYGYINQNGEIIIESQFDGITPFTNGYAVVEKDNHHFYINKDGNPISNTYESSISYYRKAIGFSNSDYAKIYNGLETIIIDQQGVELFTTTGKIFNESYYENDLIPVYYYSFLGHNEDKCVFVNSIGDIVLDDGYTDCLSFNDGLAVVKRDNRIVFINTYGEIILDNDFGSVVSMFDGVKPVIFKQGYAIVWKGATLGQPNIRPYQIYEVIDKVGKVAFTIENDSIIDVYDNYVLTQNDSGEVAIYDFNNNVILDYKYKLGSNNLGIIDGLLTVYDTVLEKYGVIDIYTGDFLIEPQYYYLSSFFNEYAVCKIEDLYYVINKDNELMFESGYSNLISIHTEGIAFETRINEEGLH